MLLLPCEIVCLRTKVVILVFEMLKLFFEVDFGKSEKRNWVDRCLVSLNSFVVFSKLRLVELDVNVNLVDYLLVI